MLDVKGLSISFGGLKAVNEFDICIEKEQLYGLIGPNGAGKTTVFNLLTGVYKPTAGKILLDGQDITGKSIIEINKGGIARTFQNIRLFKELTVIENVKVGLHNHHPYVQQECDRSRACWSTFSGCAQVLQGRDQGQEGCLRGQRKQQRHHKNGGDP